jgi:uracil-DNA glycosylase
VVEVKLVCVSDNYTTLLDAAIDHVQSLKKRGTKFLYVAPETLNAFQEAPVRATSPVVSMLKFTQSRAIPSASVASAVITPIVAATLPPVSVPVVPLSPSQRSEKEAAMKALKTRIMACVNCPNLVASRKNVVFGVGDIHASLMFVGEAPGADEDAQGEPFVGAAGQLLTKIIAAMGLSRQSVYIANILKCRPDTLGQLSGNRKPTPSEMQTCLPYLVEQIELIKPKVLVALGATAVEGLLGVPQSISKLRGNFQTYRGIPLMPTFHPSYLLRNQSVTEKRKVWEDMLKVMELLALPISDKQRGYFFK